MTPDAHACALACVLVGLGSDWPKDRTYATQRTARSRGRPTHPPYNAPPPQVTVFLTDRNQLGGYRVARDGALGDLEVASSLMIVKQLAVDEMLVEIEAIAAKADPPGPK